MPQNKIPNATQCILIKTTLLNQKDINIFQTWINLSPFQGQRSPAFGDTIPTMTSEEAKQEKKIL
ncbi:hypothetical protein WH96_05965 [Kiloniella spongiae]|uniref:Uncharacterized protein n=1 Tax=Kiloniella spongiae TaxID=1489064 RepID=A0A0H2MHG4_9PROT|nr:hypothetical protein WH96_05965 [Kiloniella spongiae]